MDNMGRLVMNANLNDRWWQRGESIGGWATAAALFVSILTFIYAYRAQERFNEKQLILNREQLARMTEGLELQKAAAEEEHRAAVAQRETAAVEALGRYMDNSTDFRAWETAEALIDLVGDNPAWRATAERMLRKHPANLKAFECKLYSGPFKQFLGDLMMDKGALCEGRAQFKPLDDKVGVNERLQQ
jgi:hypothetical protein